LATYDPQQDEAGAGGDPGAQAIYHDGSVKIRADHLFTDFDAEKP